MGYVCPVCEAPQADGRHLADHLAFTAILGDDEHEAWLDDHAPDWPDADPSDLAGEVTPLAAETEYPRVFEDATGTASRHGQGTDGDGSGPRTRTPAETVRDAPAGAGDPASRPGDGAADRDVRDVVATARELTRRRRANAATGEGASGEGASTDVERGSEAGATDCDEADE